MRTVKNRVYMNSIIFVSTTSFRAPLKTHRKLKSGKIDNQEEEEKKDARTVRL